MQEHDPLIGELEDVFDRLEAEIIADDDPIQRYARSMQKLTVAKEIAAQRFLREFELLKNGQVDICAEFARWQAAIDYKHGPAAWLAVDNQLKLQKARFVPTLWGRVGKRKKAGKVVRRIRMGKTQDDLLAYAQEHYPSLVTSDTVDKVNKDDLPVTCPHIYDETIEPEDNFYYDLPKIKENPNA